MARFLERSQDGPLGKAVYGTEDARHDGPGSLPAQFGPHPEASGATVWKGQYAEVFGGDSHGGVVRLWCVGGKRGVWGWMMSWNCP